MSGAYKVDASPRVLRWARKRARLEPEELAHKLKVLPATVQKWEENGKISYSCIRRLAKQTLTPLGLLSLSEIPDMTLPVADFRTAGRAGAPVKPSVELHSVLTLMLQRQDCARWISLKDGDPALSFPGSHDIASSTPADVARDMQRVFKLRAGWQKGDRARSWFFDAIEQSGIYPVISGIVGNNTRRKLDPEEFRGFALADDRAPLIFVNGNDAPAAQIFSLAHECAHIFIGRGGVSLCDPVRGTSQIEKFCNLAASHFLVPEDWLDRNELAGAHRYDYIGEIARRLCVSKPVIAYRARELGYISAADFDAFYAQYSAESRHAVRASGGKGGNYWASRKYCIGHRFGDAIVHAALSDEISYRDAYNLLGLSGPSFDEYVKRRSGAR